MRTDLTQDFPGVPALVQRARAVTRRDRIVKLQGTVVGLLSSVLAGAILAGALGASGAEDVFVAQMFTLMFVWGPVGLLYVEARKLDASLVADAEAVLEAWKQARAAWALTAVSSADSDVQAEVAGWTRVERERARLPQLS
ncbi:MAG: hypothetical protein KC912_20755 [Proteobacteria bacterium]|nr:hypothetical protein [Pseudomonadota bacterium]